MSSATTQVSASWLVLPERRVTAHTGDVGYTFGLCEESK
ncbi:hypothetical protein Rleg9DRAFT_1427, partial [Rhizobium leguminosarum bv. trifolii WSM597]